jgi:hypothetical protein
MTTPGSVPGVPWWVTADIHTVLPYIKVAASTISDASTVKFIKVDTDGHVQVDIVSMPSGGQSTVPGSPGSGYYYTEDENFQVGDDAAILNIYSTISRNATIGWFACDGPNDIGIEISEDGTSWGLQITLKDGESFPLDGMNAYSVRVQHLGSDSSYRIFAK